MIKIELRTVFGYIEFAVGILLGIIFLISLYYSFSLPRAFSELTQNIEKNINQEQAELIGSGRILILKFVFGILSVFDIIIFVLALIFILEGIINIRGD